nr:flagellar basal body P-ring protein FlgI [Calditrichia bacterium]
MNRMFFSTSALWIFTLMLVLAPGLSAQPRIKDVVRVESPRVALVGYGLIVGLNGSGDRSSGNRGSVFTIQSISNMLERFGITVPQEQLRTRNAAAVMVTGEIPAYGRNGTRFDITVSSLGDAKSLEGGVLLMTPLVDAAGTPFAMGQGAVSIGGFNIETSAGEQLRKNYALVG